MDAKLQQYYLQQMGIPQYSVRPAEKISPEQQLTTLKKCVESCTLCPLHTARTQTVFSRGNDTADLMIIGEAPGFNEDKQGLPFVGRAGELLNKMLSSVAIEQNEVYITNVIKCRPPENRNPARDEMTQCSQYLIQQIELVKPKFILGLGRFAAQFLVGKTAALKDLRTKVIPYQGIPSLISYHPAYLLRNPKDKSKSYADLMQLRTLLNDL